MPSVPAVAPKLTAVTVLVSPASGSVSLVSTLPVAGKPPEPLAMPPFSVASPVSATAVGAVFGVGVTTMLKVSLAARPPMIGGRDLDAEGAEIGGRRRAAERARRGGEGRARRAARSRRRRLPCR